MVTPPVRPVRRISRGALVIGAAGLALFLYAIRHVLLPFVFAGGLALAVRPLMDVISRRTGAPRQVAAIAVFILIVLILAGFGLLGLPAFSSQAASLVTDLQPALAPAYKSLLGGQQIMLFGEATNANQLASETVTAIRSWLAQPGRLAAIAGWTFTGAFGLILTLVLLLYFLLAGPSIGRGLLWLVPPVQRPAAVYLWKRIDPVLRRYFIGLAIVVAYATAVAYVATGPLLGLPHAPLLAVLTGILEIIPVLGPLVSAVLVGLVALQTAAGLWSVVGFVIYAVFLRISIDQIIGPLVLGQAARIHPVLVIFCFLAGGVLFGLVGVVLAIPVAMSLKVLLAMLYGEGADLRRRSRSHDTPPGHSDG